jgi:iron(III) transport system permease protein
VGAGPWRVFRRVTFPLILPAYFAGAVLVFIWALTDLGPPLMFNFREVIAVQIFDRISEPSSPEANALVVILLVLVAIVVLGLLGLIAALPFYFLKGGKGLEPGAYKVEDMKPVKEDERK